MKCIACQNKMVEKKGTIDLRISGKLCFVRNVSYEECPVCGERVLSPKVSQSIFERIKTKQFIEETVRIPVLDCA
ncbi:MAG: YgiT-type zinc finger protein [Desulfobacteraceae bacterium]|nr:YgiT-type zinc finger protein [Desulfobacteraceae bacterium]